MEPLLVGHSEIVLSDDVIDEKIRTGQLTLNADEKSHLFWTRPGEFSKRSGRNQNSTPVFCGHNTLRDTSYRGEEPVRSATNHINLDGSAYHTKNFLLVNFTQNSAAVIPASGIRVDSVLNEHASAIRKHLDSYKRTPALGSNMTAEGIDGAIMSFIEQKDLNKTMSIKEKKQMYLKTLTRLCYNENPKITPELQKQLAHHLLNSPKHLLKQERDLLRLSHSNETNSMHQMIKLLLNQSEAYKVRQGIIFKTPVDITTQDDQHVSHTISRHGSKYWP